MATLRLAHDGSERSFRKPYDPSGRYARGCFWANRGAFRAHELSNSEANSQLSCQNRFVALESGVRTA
jgi:hypothetical protein